MSQKNETLIESNGKEIKIDIQKTISSKVKSTKPKHRDKSDLGENFIAPDGGWGWAVAVGSGLGTVSKLKILEHIVLKTSISALHICYYAAIRNHIPRETG